MVHYLVKIGGFKFLKVAVSPIYETGCLPSLFIAISIRIANVFQSKNGFSNDMTIYYQFYMNSSRTELLLIFDTLDSRLPSPLTTI